MLLHLRVIYDKLKELAKAKIKGILLQNASESIQKNSKFSLKF